MNYNGGSLSARGQGNRQVLIQNADTPEEVEAYCEDNNMAVSASSQWKLNFLGQRPAFNYNSKGQKPMLNESLYNFSEISLNSPKAGGPQGMLRRQSVASHASIQSSGWGEMSSISHRSNVVLDANGGQPDHDSDSRRQSEEFKGSDLDLSKVLEQQYVTEVNKKIQEMQQAMNQGRGIDVKELRARQAKHDSFSLMAAVEQAALEFITKNANRRQSSGVRKAQQPMAAITEEESQESRKSEASQQSEEDGEDQYNNMNGDDNDNNGNPEIVDHQGRKDFDRDYDNQSLRGSIYSNNSGRVSQQPQLPKLSFANIDNDDNQDGYENQGAQSAQAQHAFEKEKAGEIKNEPWQNILNDKLKKEERKMVQSMQVVPPSPINFLADISPISYKPQPGQDAISIPEEKEGQPSIGKRQDQQNQPVIEREQQPVVEQKQEEQQPVIEQKQQEQQIKEEMPEQAVEIVAEQQPPRQEEIKQPVVVEQPQPVIAPVPEEAPWEDFDISGGVSERRDRDVMPALVPADRYGRDDISDPSRQLFKRAKVRRGQATHFREPPPFQGFKDIKMPECPLQ